MKIRIINLHAIVYIYRHKPIYKEFVHWVVVNISGQDGRTDATSGETVLPYIGAAPCYNSGVHR